MATVFDLPGVLRGSPVDSSSSTQCGMSIIISSKEVYGTFHMMKCTDQPVCDAICIINPNGL